MNGLEPQHDKIVLKLRVKAFVADILAVTILTKAIIWSYSNFINTFMKAIPLDHKTKLLAGLPLLEVPVLFVVFWGYFVFNYIMLEGQTPGKLIWGLEVTSHDGKKASAKQLWLRSMGSFICYFSGSFLFLIPFFNQQRKGIPDWLSSTIVAKKDEKSGGKKNVALVDLAQQALVDTETFPGQVPIYTQQEEESLSPYQETKKAA